MRCSVSARRSSEAEIPETLADWGERRLVRELRRLIGDAPDGIIGVGDDAAVIPIPIGSSMVASTDRVPGDHMAIRLGFMGPAELGRYVVEVNVSDIVAMGALPAGFLLNLGLPPDYLVEDFFSLVMGAAKRGKELGSPLVGGDSKSSSSVQVVGVALGYVPRERAVRRRGAAPGDGLFVSGPVGGTGAALAYFVRPPAGGSLSAEAESALRGKLTRPRARIDLAPLLYGTCNAVVDITDGLAESVRELERESECEFEIDWEALPLHSSVRDVAELLRVDPCDLVFGIGLDLELLFCSSHQAPIPGCTRIGEVVAPLGGGSWLKVGGERRRLPGAGFEHFRSDAAQYVVRGVEP